jgi:hypothetical protein
MVQLTKLLLIILYLSLFKICIRLKPAGFYFFHDKKVNNPDSYREGQKKVIAKAPFIPKSSQRSIYHILPYSMFCYGLSLNL